MRSFVRSLASSCSCHPRPRRATRRLDGRGVASRHLRACGGAVDGHGHLRARLQELRAGDGRPRPQPRDRRWRVHGPRRPVGLRQDDEPADDRRARGDHLGHAPDRRPRHQRRPLQGSRHRDGVPELRALPAHVGLRQPRVRAEAAQGAQDRDRPARQGSGGHARPRAAPRAQAQGPLGRPAPARRPRPRDRARAQGLPHGRAALEPRRQAPGRDARQHRPPPPAAQDHDRLRHPRPGRGDDDGRPDRGHERGPPPAGRDRPRSSTTGPSTGSWRGSSAARR